MHSHIIFRSIQYRNPNHFGKQNSNSTQCSKMKFRNGTDNTGRKLKIIKTKSIHQISEV